MDVTVWATGTCFNAAGLRATHARRFGCAIMPLGLSRKNWEIAMKAASLFVAGLAVAISSIAPANAAPKYPSAHLLPSIRVEAPKQVAAPKHSAVARSTVSRRTSPSTQTQSAPESVSAKLTKLANATGSCVGGCVTSFRYGDAPWHGCSVSGWPALSPTCRNIGNYKTYAECTEAGLITGWRANEIPWYCSSLALK